MSDNRRKLAYEAGRRAFDEGQAESSNDRDPGTIYYDDWWDGYNDTLRATFGNVPMSTCDKCGRQFPSAPPGVIHKCQCTGGMMVPNHGYSLVLPEMDDEMLDLIKNAPPGKVEPLVDIDFGDIEMRVLANAQRIRDDLAMAQNLDTLRDLISHPLLKVENEVRQHWKWGNLTRLGVCNMLVRGGFNQVTAIDKSDDICGPVIPTLIVEEKVARAICKDIIIDESGWRDWVGTARKAIAAMKELER